MIGKFQVISERINAFESKKRGRVEQKILALLDQDAICPLINTVDYVLSDDEEKEYAGKARGKVEALKTSTEAEVTELARQQENIQKHLGDKAFRKVIYVPGKIINFVI